VRRAITVGLACGAIAATSAVATAKPAAPEPSTPCAASLIGALTQLPDLTTLLRCDEGATWRVFADPYPNSKRWFTYGPPLTLHGEGQQNREIDSGNWVGVPQDPASACSARPVAIADTGGLDLPQESTGEAGRPLLVRLQPLLFTVELTGYCLWQEG
jgi:hypothetical protein